MLGLAIRWVAVLAHDARTAWGPAAVIGALFGLAAALAWRHARGILLRARVSKATLKLGGSGVDVTLDSDGTEELWRFFIQMSSRIATRPLAHGDGLIEEALTSLYTLFDRARADLSARPPRGAPLPGTVPPHIYVLDILNEDLRPCTARWHGRLEAWKRTGRQESEWPLAQACRGDIEVACQRAVERAWQLGGSLGIAELDRLLPQRPAAVPDFMAATELQKLEADAGQPESHDALKAGWRIYVEAMTRIATQELPAGAGLLGEAIASLHTLTGKIRDELASLPSPVLHRLFVSGSDRAVLADVLDQVDVGVGANALVAGEHALSISDSSPQSININQLLPEFSTALSVRLCQPPAFPPFSMAKSGPAVQVGLERLAHFGPEIGDEAVRFEGQLQPS